MDLFAIGRVWKELVDKVDYPSIITHNPLRSQHSQISTPFLVFPLQIGKEQLNLLTLTALSLLLNKP